MEIRGERAGDVDAIRALHAACFPTDGEARLVDALRAAGRLSVSVVADVDGRVIGHAAFSAVTVERGGELPGVGLGPIAVVAAHRRRGVGAALVRAGFDAGRDAGFGWCVVLGEPGYYGRLGFDRASAAGLHDEYGGGDAFRVIELIEGALPRGGGLVRYAEEFGALG